MRRPLGKQSIFIAGACALALCAGASAQEGAGSDGPAAPAASAPAPAGSGSAQAAPGSASAGSATAGSGSAAKPPRRSRRNAKAGSGTLVIPAAVAQQPAAADPQPELVPSVNPTPPGTLKSGILLPAEPASGLRAHWSARRDYLRDRDERRADDEEQKLRQLKDDLAFDNLFTFGEALVRESQTSLDASPTLARRRCQLAADLAPALPAAHLCLASASFAEEPLSLGTTFGHLRAALKASWDDPRSQRATMANAGVIALVGLLAAGALLVLLFFARYARLYLHDVHHLFPKGARTWQTSALALALVLTPLLLQMGPLPLVMTAAVACALYVSSVELGAILAVLAALAVAPWAVEGLARVSAFGGPAADVWLVEKSEGTPGALDRLQARLAQPKVEPAVPFVLAHRAKREGDLDKAERLYRRALELGGPSQMLAATHNNLGNVYLLLGDNAKATAHYGQAIALQETLAAPHFNLGRAHGMEDVQSLDSVQSEQARALELDRAAIDAFTGGTLIVGKRRPSNKLVLDQPLPESALGPLLASEANAAAPVGDDMRALIAGPLPTQFGQLLPLIAIAAALALYFGSNKLAPSGRCDRCGRAVCKRCDADARPNEGLCAQCVNVFVRKGNVDATERIQKETAVTRHQSRKKVIGWALSPFSGAAHVLLGYPVQGAIFLLLTGLIAASVFLWRGVAHDPFTVRASVQKLRIVVTLAAFAGVFVVCLRDILRRYRQEGL